MATLFRLAVMSAAMFLGGVAGSYLRPVAVPSVFASPWNCPLPTRDPHSVPIEMLLEAGALMGGAMRETARACLARPACAEAQDRGQLAILKALVSADALSASHLFSR